MKNISLFLSAILLLFYSCSKNSDSPNSVNPEIQFAANCCEVTCTNGSSCSIGTTSSGCTCSCDFWGDAKCRKDPSSGNRSSISAPSSIEAYFDGMITLVEGFTNPNKNVLIDIANAKKNLYVINSFSITIQNDLELYEDLQQQLENSLNLFSSSEQDQMLNYKNNWVP